MEKRMKKRLLPILAFSGAVVAGFAVPKMAGAQSASNMPSAAQQTETLTEFQVDYTGSLFIFPLGKLKMTGQSGPTSYSMRADMETAGLGKLAKSQGLWSTTEGVFTEKGPRPRKHIVQNLNEKARRVEIDYSSGSPVATIEPRFGSMGVPPASAAERKKSVDALSAVMTVMNTTRYKKAPCTGVVPVFDGKQHYNIKLEQAGRTNISQSSYSGDTLRCHMYLENVSGYDPEDRLTAEEAATPLVLYMAHYQDAGFWIPVRFDYRVSGIKVNIRATNIDIKTTTTK